MAESIVLPKQAEDLTGRKFWRLEVISFDRSTKSGPKWNCRCDCGTVKSFFASAIKTGHTKSCGCLNAELIRARSLKHGMTKTKAYRAWEQMKTRCGNPSSEKWEDYGGRGIRVCDRWANSFEAFLADMGEPPTARHSIDRKDVDGDYEPSNCRWATDAEQARNKRNNRLLTLGGKTQCLSQWVQETGISQSTLQNRVGKLGWSDEKALTTPPRKKRCR